MPRRLVLLLTVGCLLLPFTTAYAQTTATIRGRVTDPQDAILVGAKVVARNVATGLEESTTTTSDGLYVIPSLPSGTYDVRVEAAKFAKAEAKGITLDVGATRDVNFKLRVGGATEIVEVTGEAPLIETTKTEGSTVVNDEDLARLPVQSTNNLPFSVVGQMNDYAALAVGAPGVRFDLTGDSADLVGPGQINNRSNRYNVDGVPMNDILVVARDALGASVDEVKEFQVITNNYNAEYGQAGGLILNVITKSGTNKIHGDFHFYARGTNMEGIPYFTKLSGDLSPPPFFKHETGFTLGGPIIKDKTLWFISYEKVLAGTPLALPFPPGSSTTVTQGDDEVLWSVKFDQQITSKNHFTVRFNAQRATQSNLPVQTPAASAPSSLTGAVFHDHTLNNSLVSALTPHVINEARVSWHRYLSQTPDNSAQPGQRTTNSYEFADFCCPQGGGQNWYRGSDNLTWTRGAHTLKAGVSMDYVPWNSLFPQFHFGEWDSNCGYPQGAPGTACATSGLAAGTGGGPTTFIIGIGPAEIQSKDNVYGWFVQDSWKIRPNLTMNYGLRWDYEAGAFKGGSIPFAGGFGNGCYQANGVIPACSSDKDNFQPRLGFAWSPRFDSGILGRMFGGHDKSVISLSFAEITQLAYGNIVLDSLNFNGTPGTLQTITVNITDPNAGPVFAAWPNQPSCCGPGTALYPFISPPGAPAPPFGRIRPIAANIKNPQTRNVQLTWQRELSKSMMMSIGYVGSFGFHQFGETDTNYPLILPDPSHPGYFYAANPLTPVDPALPPNGRPDNDFDAIRTNFSNRNSAYNGLLVSVEKRYSHHLQVNGNYAWSHLISSTEGFYGVSEPSNPFFVKASTRGPSEEDARHLANFRMTVDSDNRFHFNRLLSSVLNDWAFSLIGTAQSGRPYPISTGDSILSNEYFASFGSESMQTPNVLPNGALSTALIGGAGGTTMLISSSGLTVCPTCVANTFVAPAGAAANGPIDMFTGVPVDFKYVSGNVGRNQALTDPYIRGDISLRRAFRIPVYEGVRVEFRADIFNVANHTNFWLFNGADVLSNLGPCGVTSGGIFTPAPGCLVPQPVGPPVQQAGLDVTNGLYYGNNGQILTLKDLQHGRVSSNLASPVFNGVGDPGGADIPRQAQLSVKVTW